MNVNDKVKINIDKVKLTNYSWSKETQKAMNTTMNNKDNVYEIEEVLSNGKFPIYLKGLSIGFKEDELIKQ